MLFQGYNADGGVSPRSLFDAFIRRRRDAQFVQNFESGSNSQHFNCATGGSCNVQGQQQIIGGSVSSNCEGFSNSFYFAVVWLNLQSGQSYLKEGCALKPAAVNRELKGDQVS